jgi:hypothetical protein
MVNERTIGEPHRPWDRPWATLAYMVPVTALTLALLVAVIMISDQHHQLDELREQIDIACHGVVAQLDLSEWVPICLSVQQ